MNANEQRIRERAHELWDHAGRPDGRSDEFWFAAGAESERNEGAGEGTLGEHALLHGDPSRDEPGRGEREPNSRV